MKTRELIAALQEEDPSGELEVIAGGAPIYFLTREPAYYDGALPVLVHDPDKIGFCYSIVGYKFTDRGHKIRMHLVSVEDALLDHPEMPVDLSEVSHPERLQAFVDDARARMQKVHSDVDEWDRKRKAAMKDDTKPL